MTGGGGGRRLHHPGLAGCIEKGLVGEAKADHQGLVGDMGFSAFVLGGMGRSDEEGEGNKQSLCTPEYLRLPSP